MEKCIGSAHEPEHDKVPNNQIVSQERCENTAVGDLGTNTTEDAGTLLDASEAETEGIPVGSASAVSFDLIIASDAIYSATVVSPLFETVNELLARGDASDRANSLTADEHGRHLRGQAPAFVMSQSFSYDRETDQALDAACSRHGLVREIVWDELSPATPDARECSRHRRSDDGEIHRQNHFGGTSGDRKGTKLQVFRRAPSPAL